MRITFENQRYTDVQKATAAYENTQAAGVMSVNGSYKIQGAVSDNQTYEGRTISKADLASMMQAKDVANTQDYMTVMAHTMSTEDFNRMIESGERPSCVDAEDAVTILDHIKLAVAQSGKEVEGFTDTLDSETIKAMTGRLKVKSDVEVTGMDVTIDKETMDEVLKAYNEISEITEMTDGMRKLFVGTNMPLTIDNLYLAKHTAMPDSMKQGSGYFAVETPGYLVKKADVVSEDDINREVKALLDNLGIEADDRTVLDGTWLVNNSVCVNEQNINDLRKVNSIVFPVSDIDFARMAASAIAEGKNPKDALVTRTDSIYNEAVKLTRVMEETRLKMTTEANLELLKSDYSIDTTDLEAYVEALKKMEENPEYKELREIAKTEETIYSIRELPAAVIGRFGAKIPEVSLSDINLEGQNLKAKYEAAGIAYEQVGTEVRKDLGDSIRKAFRNVDDILKDLGFDTTDENRRSVRILGYNSMPINKASVEEIREADRKIQSVINRLTPEDTLKLIRKGTSPVDMSIKDLNEYLDGKSDEQIEEIEKYSKFLYKLEKNHEITPEERKEYIEVYRFFHQLEKTDLAAVGSVLNAGMDLTIGNLKTAIKSAKHTGMDVKVGEPYAVMVSEIKNDLMPEKLVNIDFSDNTSLDSMYEQLSGQENDASLEAEWNHQLYTELREAMRVPEETVTHLVMNAVPVNADNLESAFLMMKRKGKVFADADKAGNGKLRAKAAKIAERFVGKEAAQEGYSELISDAKDDVYEASLMQDTYTDVRAMKLTHLQLSTAHAFSQSETYEVPVEIGGEVTSVTLKVVHNRSEEPNVVVTMETNDYGRVSARFTCEEEKINGYIACNFRETVTKMEKVADKLGTGVKVVFSTHSDSDAALASIPMRENTSDVSSDELYKAARQFLDAMKGL